MYRDAPNLDEELGLTLPRVNLLIEQGERRRTRESMMLAGAIRIAHGEKKLDEVFRLPPERRRGDGTPDAPPVDTTPWWDDDELDPDEE